MMIECIKCSQEFNPESLESTDEGSDEQNKTCPVCLREINLQDKECEHCEEPTPAKRDVGGHYLCEEHYDEL